MAHTDIAGLARSVPHSGRDGNLTRSRGLDRGALDRSKHQGHQEFRPSFGYAAWLRAAVPGASLSWASGRHSGTLRSVRAIALGSPHRVGSAPRAG